MKKTYYDALKRIRPYLIPHIRTDVELLRSQGARDPIMNADDFDSSVPHILKDMGQFVKEQMCAATGTPEHLVPENLQELGAMLIDEERQHLRALIGTVNYEYHAFLNFELFGRRTFLMADSLVEDLAQTSVNLRCDLLHLPFPSCMLVFTSPVAINVLAAISGREIDDLSARHPAVRYDVPISVIVTLGAADARFPHRRLIISAFHSDETHQDAMINRQLYLDDDWPIEQALRTDWNEIYAQLKIDDEVDTSIGGRAFSRDEGILRVVPIDDDAFYTDGLLFFRLVLNAILYITSTEADMVNKASSMDMTRNEFGNGRLTSDQRRRLGRARSALSELPYCEVGFRLRPIVIDHDKSEPARTVVGPSGRKINVRFKVRGHWRAQRCGPGRRDIRTTWVRDHEKGPSIAEAVNRQYLVE